MTPGLDGLDEWITGHYGEDQFRDAVFCTDCMHYNGGMCFNEKSPYHKRLMEEEETCDEAEVYDPRDDEPQDLDERR
jgi:hypothetical protein